MHWTPLKTRESPLRTAWQADDITVHRGDELIDRLRADEIQRVALIHAGAGESPAEVLAALFEMPDRAVLLGAVSGIAGRVLFERQAYWAQRDCIFWVSERQLAWSQIEGGSRWPFARHVPRHRELTVAELASFGRPCRPRRPAHLGSAQAVPRRAAAPVPRPRPRCDPSAQRRLTAAAAASAPVARERRRVVDTRGHADRAITGHAPWLKSFATTPTRPWRSPAAACTWRWCTG